MLRDIRAGRDAQVEAVLALLAHVDADVLVLAGIDGDHFGQSVKALAERLGNYPHLYSPMSNRGQPSGQDLDGDGRFGEAEDAIGYGEFRGQGGMAVLSKRPLDRAGARDFSRFNWRDLPGHLALAGTPEDFPLSTTVHWDLPVILEGGRRLHLLIWHATPPVFDGPEDRNGRRNHDEAAYWQFYLDGGLGAPPAHFVLAGISNLDPAEPGRAGALRALLSDPRLRDPAPESVGGKAAAGQGGANARHQGDPARDTVDWEDGPGRPGNLRVDLLVPSANLSVTGAGVLWPEKGDPLFDLVETASRHRLVWLDLELD